QDHPPGASRLRGRLRRGDGRGGARAGPPSLRRPGRARPRRRRRRTHPRRGAAGARLMAYRVLLTDALGPEGLARLREQPELEIEARPGLSPAELRDAVRGFHALIIRSGTKVTADVLARADALRVIGRAGIGVDNVDVDAATKKGIVVMNTPGGSNVTTAEHAITLLLALARNVPQAAAGVRAGRGEREKWLGTEVCNKVLGIIGLGNIGTIVAERALGLRMKVIAYDPFVTAEVAARLRVELVSLDEIYARADFITIHTPLTPETRGLIGAATLARMKRGVRVVNCARGGIVDEEALAAAIRSGQVAGAALPVLPPHLLDPSVNYVNAPAIARERGIKVVESRATQLSDYLNAVRVGLRTASRTTAVEGAVFGAETIRLTKIDGFRMEAVPEGHILMLHNRDVPGVVGRVGTLLGERGVNIAGLELGRERVGG